MIARQCPPLHYGFLPLFAQISIERLDSDNAKRNGNDLDMFLDHYAQCYGQTCSELIRYSAHHICKKRFWDYAETTEGQACAAPVA